MRISRLLEVRSAFICETDLTTNTLMGSLEDFRYAYLFAAIGANEAFELVIFCLFVVVVVSILGRIVGRWWQTGADTEI